MQRREFLLSIAIALETRHTFSIARSQPRIRYSNAKAIAYAKKYASLRDNSCKVFLDGEKKTDCAHFVAHCLAAGGIVVKNPDQNNQLCPTGLAVRNVDIEAYLSELSTKYANVKKQSLIWDAIVGDIGFLHVERPRHAFMVCEPVDTRVVPPKPVKVWAHSGNRSCEEMDAQWRQWFSSSFRLEDGT